MTSEAPIRLNKYLALHLGLSRREADDFIAQGSVTINGERATLGARLNPGDKTEVDGKPISGDVAYKYVALHKPVGYVCSRRQQGDNPTIYDLLPPDFTSLKPVGRLDKDTSGIILLSNDGDFALRMTHPRYTKTKVYQAQLDKDLSPLHQQMISDYGVTLEDGPSKLSLERLTDTDRKSWQITMHEGRNRQIRRTFSSLGYTVIKLHRTNFGNYALGDILPSKYETVDMR